MNNISLKEAIEKRRSIRKFKSDAISDADILELLDAARLAPSGCNAQPWRFKIVKDQETKNLLVNAAYGQSFIASAPVVLVCCVDIQGYLTGMVSGVHDLFRTGAVEERISNILMERTSQMETQMKVMSHEQLGSRISFNVAIAVEHIVLSAVDHGLGSCWIRLMDEQAVRKIFGWEDTIYVVALLPIGYPDEAPTPRKRLSLDEIIMK